MNPQHIDTCQSASGPFMVEDTNVPSAGSGATSSVEPETSGQKLQTMNSSASQITDGKMSTSSENTEMPSGSGIGNSKIPTVADLENRCRDRNMHRTGKKRNYRTRSQENEETSDEEMNDNQRTKNDENGEVSDEDEHGDSEENEERAYQPMDIASISSPSYAGSEPANASSDNFIPLSPSIHESADEEQLQPNSLSQVESSESGDSDGFPPFREDRVPTRRHRSDVPPLVTAVLEKKPKVEKWNILRELRKRESRISSNRPLEEMFSSSQSTIRKMAPLSKLEHHSGCVNGLNFNQSGTRLASASDDLTAGVWDWANGKLLLAFDTGHKANVFQAKFLPLLGDTHIITAARDGQVRLAEITPAGGSNTRRVAQHRGPCHKVASVADSPHVLLTSGEDAAVFEIDIRERKGKRIMIAKQDSRKIPLYSIMGHPLDGNLFLVGGCEEFSRVYDRRRLAQAPVSGAEPVQKFCPQKLMLSTQIRAHVTSCVYNHDGSEILATYNDDDIYLFDTSHSEGAEAVHRYVGARNSATVKGVNFFGPKGEYIVSGSDCGHIFFWDKESEAIMKILPGDDNGVVNVLEPHPSFPILATGGLDDDVKLWAPVGDLVDSPPGLKDTIQQNLEERENDGTRESGSIDGEMLWMLWRHLNRTERRRRANQDGNAVEESDASDESEVDRGRRHHECTMS